MLMFSSLVIMQGELTFIPFLASYGDWRVCLLTMVLAFTSANADAAAASLESHQSVMISLLPSSLP